MLCAFFLFKCILHLGILAILKMFHKVATLTTMAELIFRFLVSLCEHALNGNLTSRVMQLVQPSSNTTPPYTHAQYAQYIS